jgi:hypothetical protein
MSTIVLHTIGVRLAESRVVVGHHGFAIEQECNKGVNKGKKVTKKMSQPGPSAGENQALRPNGL